MNVRALIVSLALFFFALAGRAHAEEGVMTFDGAAKLFAESNVAFEKGEWTKALDGYERVIRAGHASPAVLGNAGAAARRLGDTGKSVLYYRRALRTDPGYDRALQSLRVIAPAASTEQPSFMSAMIEGLFSITSPTFWVVLMDVLLLVGSWFIWRGLSESDPERRAHNLSLCGYAFFFVLVCGGVAFGNERWRRGGNEAVVMKDNASGRSAPTDAGQELLLLPAGTTITLTEEPARGYVRFRLPDGSAAYISTGAVERI